MEQDTLLTYNSLIPEEGDQWVRLPNSDQLVQLHGKFWGVNSMQDEETKWCEMHPEEEPLNVEDDNQKPKEHEKEEDDIGPSSYVLTLDIPNMPLEVSQLWIHQEYIRVYDICEKYLEACIPAHLTPSAILTGQPGISLSWASQHHHHWDLVRSKREKLLGLLLHTTISCWKETCDMVLRLNVVPLRERRRFPGPQWLPSLYSQDSCTDIDRQWWGYDWFTSSTRWAWKQVLHYIGYLPQTCPMEKYKQD